jgi:Flp pilus assembly pilin Flp
MMIRRDPRRDERGQAMVEFALLAPLFMLIVAGIIQFGVGLNFWLDMQRIANQGARWAAVNRYPGCVSGNVVCTGPTLQEYLASEPVSGGLQPCVTVEFDPTGSTFGKPVTLALDAPFTLVPILDIGTLHLRADATMRLEQDATRFAAGLGGTSC